MNSITSNDRKEIYDRVSLLAQRENLSGEQELDLFRRECNESQDEKVRLIKIIEKNFAKGDLETVALAITRLSKIFTLSEKENLYLSEFKKKSIKYLELFQIADSELEGKNYGKVIQIASEILSQWPEHPRALDLFYSATSKLASKREMKMWDDGVTVAMHLNNMREKMLAHLEEKGSLSSQENKLLQTLEWVKFKSDKEAENQKSAHEAQGFSPSFSPSDTETAQGDLRDNSESLGLKSGSENEGPSNNPVQYSWLEKSLIRLRQKRSLTKSEREEQSEKYRKKLRNQKEAISNHPFKRAPSPISDRNLIHLIMEHNLKVAYEKDFWLRQQNKSTAAPMPYEVQNLRIPENYFPNEQDEPQKLASPQISQMTGLRTPESSRLSNANGQYYAPEELASQQTGQMLDLRTPENSLQNFDSKESTTAQTSDQAIDLQALENYIQNLNSANQETEPLLSFREVPSEEVEWLFQDSGWTSEDWNTFFGEK